MMPAPKASVVRADIAALRERMEARDAEADRLQPEEHDGLFMDSEADLEVACDLAVRLYDETVDLREARDGLRRELVELRRERDNWKAQAELKPNPIAVVTPTRATKERS